jgi:hypothetical protein
MPFMPPEVEHGFWYIVDGPAGTEVVPADLVGAVTVIKPDGRVTVRFPTADELREADNADGDHDDVRFPVPAALRQFCENRECWSVDLGEGWGARLSAPGYLDCTPWSVFDTREEAEAALRDEEDES